MPRRRVTCLGSALLSALLAVGCDGGNDGDTEGTGDGTETQGETEAGTENAGETGELNDPFIPGRHCDESSSLTWQSWGQGFILSQCAGCHSSNIPEGMRADAPVGVDFETQELTQQWLDRIYARAADENVTMPPVDGIDAEQRVLLGDWLACGAP